MKLPVFPNLNFKFGRNNSATYLIFLSLFISLSTIARNVDNMFTDWMPVSLLPSVFSLSLRWLTRIRTHKPKRDCLSSAISGEKAELSLNSVLVGCVRPLRSCCSYTSRSEKKRKREREDFDLLLWSLFNIYVYTVDYGSSIYLGSLSVHYILTYPRLFHLPIYCASLTCLC